MRYQIYPDNPDVYVGIQKDSETGGFRYVVVEPRLTLWEKQVYQKLTRLLVDELEVDMAKLKNNKSAEVYLVEEAKTLAKKYKINVAPESYKKIAYYFVRDYIKLGRIEVLMNDPRIEDVSCDGPRIPLFIWHRDYESIPTNVMFQGDEELNTFASKLAYVSGKHISIAAPIVDATLPDGSRIQITYGKEITKKGSTFTIRKFKGDPITIVDLLKYNTLSPELGAYLWYLIEKRMSLLVAGGTASGKSIPHDEKVSVYQSGMLRTVPIGELYEEFATSSECRREDEYEILDLHSIETLAFDSNLSVGIFPVASVVRHPAEKTIFKVKTRGGREVCTTGDHSIFVSGNGSAQPYPVVRLRPGMHVAVPSSVPVSDAEYVTLHTKMQAGQLVVARSKVELSWDEVVEVEEVPYSGEYVYDLEVPDVQNFVGGVGGVFLHNTTTLNALSMFIPPDQKIVSVEDSVVGDAEILVSERGAVRKVKIGPYIDQALQDGTTLSPTGHELAKPNDLRVLTADSSGRVLWSDCTALIRHKVHKDFVNVRTRTGRTVEVTADHSLFSLDEAGELSNISGRDISVGTFLVVPRSLPSGAGNTFFDLSTLPEFARYTIRAAPGTTVGQPQQLRVHAVRSSLSIPAQIELNQDIAFLAGLWIADGFYGARTVGFSAGAKDIESRLRSTTDLLGLNLKRHSDGISLLIHSQPLKTFFEKTLELTGDDYTRHIPDVFFGAPDDVVASLLRGYFTGDGNVSAGEVFAESASMQLLRDIQTLLLRFGIILSVGSKRKIGSLGGLGTFRASIVGTAQVSSFARKVGFEQSSQMKKLFARTKSSKYFLDPVPLNDLLAREVRESKTRVGATKINDALRQRLNKGVKRGIVSRKTLLDLAEADPQFRGSKAYALATSGFYFDPVVSVEYNNREEMVYDLSVPETGRFIANNILCHNTPELNLSHKNWIQSVSRGGGLAGEITLFDLLKAAMRQRPDIIIVGEVRGVEAFTLFQAIASVTGDTPVLVREGGRAKLTEIGHFVDGFYSGSEERVPKHVDGREVLSFERSGGVAFSPVKYVLRHRADEIYKVGYAGGRIRATGSHSVFVFDADARIMAKPVSSLSEVDTMVSFCGSELRREQPSIDVEAILRLVEGHRVITEKPRPNCPSCCAPNTSLKGHIGAKQRYQCGSCRTTFVDSPELVFTNALLSQGRGLVAFERSLALPKLMTVDEEFARVLGIYLADGCVKTHKGSSRVVFCLGAAEKALFAEDATRFFARFGSAPYVEDRGTYVMLEFNHSPMAEVFRELCGAQS